jgi:hypothetical protein
MVGVCTPENRPTESSSICNTGALKLANYGPSEPHQVLAYYLPSRRPSSRPPSKPRGRNIRSAPRSWRRRASACHGNGVTRSDVIGQSIPAHVAAQSNCKRPKNAPARPTRTRPARRRRPANFTIQRRPRPDSVGCHGCTTIKVGASIAAQQKL